MRKLEQFITLQRKTHSRLKAILSEVPEISFRTIPDPDGDIFSFLSWFLPSEEITREVVGELRQQGILPGNFYWYDNNWHYIRKWDHLRNAQSLNPLSDLQKQALLALDHASFAASDRVMGRCISTAIGLLWTTGQTEEKGAKIVAVVRKVLAGKKVSAV